ncbi:uncharacterized protein SPPG_03883 [Spizellomyces punctatus DAOM BR117]|uniref:Gamma tubulin complex component C-terminal domain-containing protein n=1 Tax=Spizellomyces punctatus (strain DAOM BR117) TaxID=645134 RepID=A0A0L0HIQ3_SPIPD|nr:uncharacterized protein SPPG_03883 [Spizellomyces punctatus DAOM BR117]KND00770.1 hypothetical protein SPPG_03883 [Spizellomyces punctatus DAOM BR117]|eukprot:XP_016608809.1 hypothetical protein SPPG_03883 [Spizellomyces punctatus DAOM BR117]
MLATGTEAPLPRSFLPEFADLCTKILHPSPSKVPTADTLFTGQRPTIRQISPYLTTFFTYTLDDRIHTNFSSTRPEAWTGKLQERVATILYKLREDRNFDSANALEGLLEKIGFYCGNFDIDDTEKNRDTIELAKGSSAEIIPWKEKLAVLWLIMSLGNVQKGSPNLSSFAKDVLASRYNHILQYDSSATSDPCNDKAFLMPSRYNLQLTDSPAMESLLRSHHPYDIVYPPAVFESGLRPAVDEIVVERDVLEGSSLFLKGVRKGDSYDDNKTRTIFGALTHPSINMPRNVWNLEVHMALPRLGTRPQAISALSSGMEGSGEQEADQRSAQVSRISYDSGYEDHDDIWTSLRRENETLITPLRSWEMLDAHYQDRDARRTDRHMVSPYVSEASFELFDAIYRNHFSHEFNREEYLLVAEQEQLLKDVMNLIIGIQSDSFVYIPETMEFRISQDAEGRLRTLGCSATSFQRYLRRFLAIGTNMIRLEHVVRMIEDDTSHGQIGLAFAHALASFVSFIRACLVAVPDSLGDDSKHLQLIRLYHALNEPFYLLTVLTEICQCSESPSYNAEGTFQIPRGATLLSRLYDAACAVDTVLTAGTSKRDHLLRLILLGLLQHTTRPYFAWFEQWLGLPAGTDDGLETLGGLIEQMTDVWDPYGEFFVQYKDIPEQSGGEAFWRAGWQMNQASPAPSFIPLSLAQEILHAGKYLRLLRLYQRDHPLVRLQDEGKTLRALLRQDGRLRWIWQEDEAFRFCRAIDLCIHEMNNTIMEAEKATAEAAHSETRRIEERIEETKKQQVRLLDAKAEQMRKAKEEQVQKKRALQSEIDEFLAERDALKRAHAEQAKAEAEKHLEQEVEKEHERLRLVEEEKRRMIEQHEARMREIQKKEELLEWKRQRLMLGDKRREVLERGWSTVEESINAAYESRVIAGERVELDAKHENGERSAETELKELQEAPDESFVTASEHSVTAEVDTPIPSPEEIMDEAVPTAELMQENESSPNALDTITSSDVPPPSHPSNYTLSSNDDAGAPSLYKYNTVPNLAEMGSLNALLDPSSLSPFFAPGFGQAQHSVAAVPAATQTVETEVGPEYDVPSGDHANAIGTVGATTIESMKETSKQESLPPLDTNEDPPKTTVALSGTFSFARFLENNLPNEVPWGSDISVESSLSILTMRTLHSSLSSFSTLISKAVMNALYPGIRTHLGIAGRYLLLGDRLFLTRLTKALFEEGGGVDVDGRTDGHWPPGFGELSDALQGVVPEHLHGDVHGDIGKLSFEGKATERNAGALDALSFLRLQYTAPMPFDIVMTESTAHKYDRIFEFMLVLERVRIALDRVCVSEWWWRNSPARDTRRAGESWMKGDPDSRDPVWKSWSERDRKAAVHLHWEARAFVGGLLRYGYEIGIGEVWEGFQRILDRETDNGLGETSGMDLEEVYKLHHMTLDRIQWRLLMRAKQKPVMGMVEGMLQIALKFARKITGMSDGQASSGQSPHEGEGEIVKLLNAFRIRFAMLVKVLRGMIERDLSGSSSSPRKGGSTAVTAMGNAKEMACFARILVEVDGNGYVERELVPQLGRLQREVDG